MSGTTAGPGQALKRKVRDFNFACKAVKKNGEFEGYASVFDVIDFYREVVIPGAFADTIAAWRQKDRFPPALWQHSWYEPIGPITEMEEDEHGLFVKGQLLIDDVPRAREARALIAAKAITGMSFGFDVIEDEYDSRAGVLKLNKIDLWEVSVVTFPANEAAQIEGIKGFNGRLPTVQEFERFLCEAGFSRSHAKAIACHGLGYLQREVAGRQAKGAPIDVEDIAARVIARL